MAKPKKNSIHVGEYLSVCLNHALTMLWPCRRARSRSGAQAAGARVAAAPRHGARARCAIATRRAASGAGRGAREPQEDGAGGDADKGGPLVLGGDVGTA